jgi:hypothetical protein
MGMNSRTIIEIRAGRHQFVECLLQISTIDDTIDAFSTIHPSHRILFELAQIRSAKDPDSVAHDTFPWMDSKPLFDRMSHAFVNDRLGNSHIFPTFDNRLTEI